MITAEFAPGYVSLLLVPDLANQNILDPLQPACSYSRRKEVRHFLQERMSAFAAEKLSVINPFFEPVQVELTASFRSGLDVGYHREKLSNDLQEFLSPWAFGKTESFRFGGSVHKSMIVNFVDELPYVDYVTDVIVTHKSADSVSEVDMASAKTARSVLTSAPAHIIHPAMEES
jgi:hypothetical protein